MMLPPRLRCITYMTPGLPGELFQGVVDFLSSALEIPATLEIDSRFSGPPPGPDNPFTAGEAELGWMCTPSYFWLRESEPTSVVLVPAAMVFSDPRNDGHPRYYSDVITHQSNRVSSLSDLRGQRWTYNDTSSQSGYYNLLEQLAEMGESLSFFSSVSASGSHLESLRQVALGEADAAAIDSNVLAHQLATNPGTRDSIRVVTSWGPHAIQPMVAGAHVDPALVVRIAELLGSMHEHPTGGNVLRHAGVDRIVAIDESQYLAERASLRTCEKFLRS